MIAATGDVETRPGPRRRVAIPLGLVLLIAASALVLQSGSPDRLLASAGIAVPRGLKVRKTHAESLLPGSNSFEVWGLLEAEGRDAFRAFARVNDLETMAEGERAVVEPAVWAHKSALRWWRPSAVPVETVYRDLGEGGWVIACLEPDGRVFIHVSIARPEALAGPF